MNSRSYLSQILQITGGNVSQAARLAKRTRTDFYKLLSRHQLTPEESNNAERGDNRRARPRPANRCERSQLLTVTSIQCVPAGFGSVQK